MAMLNNQRVTVTSQDIFAFEHFETPSVPWLEKTLTWECDLILWMEESSIRSATQKYVFFGNLTHNYL